MWKFLAGLFVGVLTVSPALAQDAAFNGDKAANAYYEARPACRLSEFFGKPISEYERDMYCVFLDALGFQLKANGWCWDKGDLVWEKCKN